MSSSSIIPTFSGNRRDTSLPLLVCVSERTSSAITFHRRVLLSLSLRGYAGSEGLVSSVSKHLLRTSRTCWVTHA